MARHTRSAGTAQQPQSLHKDQYPLLCHWDLHLEKPPMSSFKLCQPCGKFAAESLALIQSRNGSLCLELPVSAHGHNPWKHFGHYGIRYASTTTLVRIHICAINAHEPWINSYWLTGIALPLSAITTPRIMVSQSALQTPKPLSSSMKLQRRETFAASHPKINGAIGA